MAWVCRIKTCGSSLFSSTAKGRLAVVTAARRSASAQAVLLRMLPAESEMLPSPLPWRNCSARISPASSICGAVLGCGVGLGSGVGEAVGVGAGAGAGVGCTGAVVGMGCGPGRGRAQATAATGDCMASKACCKIARSGRQAAAASTEAQDAANTTPPASQAAARCIKSMRAPPFPTNLCEKSDFHEVFFEKHLQDQKKCGRITCTVMGNQGGGTNA